MTSGLGHAKDFRELVVYQRARKVARKIFESTKSFPKEETYALTDQVRRSSRSIGAQIAEGWGKRRYERHFISKLTDADAEVQETRHWISTARDCGYLTDSKADEMNRDLSEIGRMLKSMIDKARLFCGEYRPLVKEGTIEYFAIESED